MDAFVSRSLTAQSRRPLADVSNSSKRQSLTERPSKKLKLAESATSSGDDDSDASEDDSQLTKGPSRVRDNPKDGPDGSVSRDGTPTPEFGHETAFESSLPAVQTEKEAIEEYEAIRASQISADTTDDASSRIDSRRWVRGKSSIYVDAFNLALDTVLEDESHLFDAREKAVFESWQDLGYEAQYLYVRLFLRKTSAWHRSDRLGYYSDISDPEAAIESLQKIRGLPQEVEDAPTSSPFAGVPLQDWSLGESFTFADRSEDWITTVEEAAPLLSLDELKSLARTAKVQGKNKPDLQKALIRMSSQQANLMALGLRRSSTEGSNGSGTTAQQADLETPEPAAQLPNQNAHFLGKIMAVTGPCIRISPPVFKLFERVHLVYYRSTEWTEKSLTTIILAKISRRNFPTYIVCRSANIFASRQRLLEFEQAMRMEHEVDSVLENGPTNEEVFRRILDVFDSISPQWRAIMQDEQRKEEHEYEFNEGAYLRRFNAAHSFTRIAHKTAYAHGRLHEYASEHALLTELLEQRLFQPARRGAWYQRKALLEERYMAASEQEPAYTDEEQQKKHWLRIAVTTCETALEDRDCHLIYHYDLQKRLLKLERRLRIPRRLQHDFGHVQLHKPEEHTVSGIQLKKSLPDKNTKTEWVDEHEGGGPCSVEEMCLSDYRTQGWKGYHAEGGIVRTLFALLFYDVLFATYVPNVFQTAFQTCPLDLHTDAFYAARASDIAHRLVQIANGDAPDLVRRVWDDNCARRTCVVGLNWDFARDDLLELAGCFGGEALAAVCKVMAQEYRQRGGGIPDLILWRTEPARDVLFAEVKSANDRLSDTQRLWMHVLTGAGVRVALCAAVAREVRVVD